MVQSVFGKVDYNKAGKRSSTMPSWYYPRQRDELEESIRYKKSQLENDLVPSSEKNYMRESLKMEEKRIQEIEESQPRFSEVELDELAKLRKSMGMKISDAMFKRSEMERGVADAHEEARRMSEPVLKLEDKELVFVRACEGKIEANGKVSRTTAERCWKIISRLLGENSNTEVLRKP
jgi:hypothetical protein